MTNIDALRGVSTRSQPSYVAPAPVAKPTNGIAPAATSNGLHDEEEYPRLREVPWPVMDEAAFHGIAGEIVRTIEPESESDPVGLLMHILVGFGAMAGQGPHAVADSTKHPARLFAVTVGDTATARKGTAWSNARRVLRAADNGWMDTRQGGGVSSGEGLIFKVRDPRLNLDDDKKTDEGAESNELLLVETEFSKVLVVSGREGNTLSDQMRIAWDGGILESMVKKDPIKATNPHICLLGHITTDDLANSLSAKQIANGWGNRILWPMVKRSKIMPEGGYLDDAVIQDLGTRLRGKLDRARQIGRMTRSDEARELWADVYYKWAHQDRLGLLGQLTARPEAQTLRLSVAYALLDGSSIIELSHLQAALAVWRYCEQSVYRIFGSVSGSPMQDKLLDAITKAGERGLTATEQNDVFNGHVMASELEKARNALAREGLIQTYTNKETGGRPRKITVLARYAPGGAGQVPASAEKASEYPLL